MAVSAILAVLILQQKSLTCFCVIIENGEPVLKKNRKRVLFVNLEMKLFKDRDSLCPACADCCAIFPFGLRIIKTITGEYPLFQWNKGTSSDDGEYGFYGMRNDTLSRVLFDTCYILEFEKDGEIYGIYFPFYELNVLKNSLAFKSKEII